MSVNPSKCHLLQYNPRSIGRQFNPQYTIENVPIEQCSVVRDLGILMSHNLKIHEQVDQACKRANAEINRIRRSFICRSPSFRSSMYKLYVRPHMEYAIEVWNPQDIASINKLEKVQNRMTRMIPAGNILNPEQRNQLLGLTTHENRRLRGDLINMYKNLENTDLFTLRNDFRFRGHSKTLKIPVSNCMIKKNSFSSRSIHNWNRLPEDVVSSPTLNIFKRKLDVYMSQL